jgi:hypothetical protein
MTPDVLGDALRLTQKKNQENGPLGFQRFD